MKINQFFNTPIFKFALHLGILLGIIVNCIYNYQVWAVQKKYIEQAKNLETLRQKNRDAQNKQDYYNSNLYRDKYIKEEGFVRPGEEVIDPMIKENTVTDESTDYIDLEIEKQENNLQKWWQCFFSGVSLPQNYNEKKQVLESLCRVE